MSGNVCCDRRAIVVFLICALGTPVFASAPTASPGSSTVESKSACRESGCGKYGTPLNLYDDVQAAAKRAAAESKPLFVIQLSGNFKKATFT